MLNLSRREIFRLLLLLLLLLLLWKHALRLLIIHGPVFAVAEAEHTAACYCYSVDTAAEHNLDSAEEESQPIA
jgi:hypothetical protein